VTDPTTAKRRFTIQVGGFEKCGKSWMLCSMPDPLILQFDTNVACAEGYDHLMIDFTAMEPLDAYNLYTKQVLPALWNRQPERLNEHEVRGRDLGSIQSVCKDSETFAFEVMQESVPIPKTAKSEPDTFRWYRILRELKKQEYYRLMSLARPFPADPTKPRYNVGVSCHMKGEYRDVPGTNPPQRVLERYVPAIEGSFKDKWGAYAGTLMWCEKKGTGPDTKHICYTRSPDRLRVCGDSVGGHGLYKVLPAEIENTWPALLAGWGISGP